MNFYRTNFHLVHSHKWGSFKDLDEMIPYERDIYKAMLVAQLKDEAEAAREETERQKNYQSLINSRSRQRK